MTSALEALIFNHWTAREVPEIVFKDVCIWEGQVGYGKEGKGWTPSNSSFGLNYMPRDKFAKISVLDKVYSDELMMVFIAPKWNYSHFKHLWKSVKILTFLPGLWHTAVQRSKLVWGEWPVCFLSRERFQGNRAQLIIQNNGIWVKLNSCVYKLFSWVFWLMMSSFTENHVDNLSWNEHPWFDFWFHQQLAGRLYLGHWPSLWLTFLPSCKSTCISEDQIEGWIDGVWSVLGTNQTIVGACKLGILLTESYYYTCFLDWETKPPSLGLSEVGLEPLPLEPGPFSLSLPNKYSSSSN